MSNENTPQTSESPTRRGTTSDKERKSSSQDDKTTGKPVTKQESNVSYNNHHSSNNSTEHREKTSDGKTGSQGSAQENRKKPTGIWCSSDSPMKENQKITGGTQTSECTQVSTYHTPDPRAGYLQVNPSGIYPIAASSNYFPPVMNFPPQPVFQQSNRNNERYSPEEQPGGGMMPQTGCKAGWRDEFLPSQANYPNAPLQFQMLPRSGNARQRNNYNNKVQGNYVQPRMIYSDGIEKPSQNYPPNVLPPSQPPGVYSHNYFQDPAYNVRSPRKGDRQGMPNYGKKEIERQRGLKNPAHYYADQREAMNCKRALPTSEDYRYNYHDGRDPRFLSNRQFVGGSPKYPNDMRSTDGVRRDFTRYPSPPERLLDREIGYPPMPYTTVDQNPFGSVRYPNQPGYRPSAEYKPCWKTQVEPMFMNQERTEHWPATGLGGASVSQNLNVTRSLMDFQRNNPGENLEDARARHEQPYYDPRYQITRVRSNEKFDYPGNYGQRRPMPHYSQPPMMSSTMPPMMSSTMPPMMPSTMPPMTSSTMPPMMPQMMPPMMPQMMPPMLQNPPPHYQGMPPQQMHQQNGPDCYGVLLDEIDITQPASHLRRCGDFPEIMHKAIPESCDKKNSQN